MTKEIEIPKDLFKEVATRDCQEKSFAPEFRINSYITTVFNYLRAHPALALEIAGMGWRKYPEEKPEIGKWVIVYFEGGELGNDDRFESAYLMGNYKFDCEEENEEVGLTITHWCSLPPMPEEPTSKA